MITLQQYIAKEKDRLRRIAEDKRPLFLASQSALAEMSERIFTRGESVSGGKFQYANGKPFYATPGKIGFGAESSLTPRGKNGETHFKNGKRHKSVYVNSYGELRGLLGRENSFVNFEATGELKSEIENRSSGGITPKQVSQDEYKVSVEKEGNTEKLRGLIDKYPGVFQLSESEKATFYNTYNKEILLLIRQAR